MLHIRKFPGSDLRMDILRYFVIFLSPSVQRPEYYLHILSNSLFANHPTIRHYIA
jgi:hypothetical protein